MKKNIISILIGIAVAISSVPSLEIGSSVVTSAEAAPKKKTPKAPKTPQTPKKKAPPVCKKGKRCGNACIPVEKKCSL